MENESLPIKPEIFMRIETQMRAGTHYLISNLIRVYKYMPAIVTRAGEIEVKNLEYLNKGLHDKFGCDDVDPGKIIIQSHYYSPKLAEIISIDCPVIYQIGFPFDSFISDAMNYKAYGKYDATPTKKNPIQSNYILQYDSEEFEKLKKYMIQNAKWLEWLHESEKELLIRYEDYYNDFLGAINKISKHCGKFKGEFHTPYKNVKRVYWNEDFRKYLDREAFDFIMDCFGKTLFHFWPEKANIKY